MQGVICQRISTTLMTKITWTMLVSFTFRMNETCLSSDHNIFMVAPTDTDAHNPILVHLKPSDMQWGEKQKYRPFEMKKRRKEDRKAIQQANKRRAWEDDDKSTWQDWRKWSQARLWLERQVTTWLWWILSFIRLDPLKNMETKVSVYFCR